MLDVKRVIASSPKKPQDVPLLPLTTPWTGQVRQGGAGGEERGSDCARQEDNKPVQKILNVQACISQHPHPQFEREHFELLNGWWEYTISSDLDAQAAWRTERIPSHWTGRIRVPFSPEAPLSEVNRQLKPNELLWYRRVFDYPRALQVSEDATDKPARLAHRCILHFEAVDYACACYCNGRLLGTHQGGYLPFAFDITEALEAGSNELTLCVYDPSDEGVQLRGKQKLARGGIWYTAQSGIWQSVWLEVVPAHHLTSLTLDANVDEECLTVTIGVHDAAQANEAGNTHDTIPNETDIPLTVELFDDEKLVGTATTRIESQSARSKSKQHVSQDVHLDAATQLHTITVAVPNPHLWSPEDPHLYTLNITYGDDQVLSYCAFRTITMQRDEQGISRLHLNHEPCFLRGVLDQGYWPDGLMTAPSDEALVYDIQTMRDLGFNMLRKHIKIESDRWYYHCDRLGMLVWQDMVCGGSPPKPWYASYLPTFFRWSWSHYHDGPRHFENLAASSQEFRSEWTKTCVDTLAYLGNHPSIITWVLFNEAWGQFDAQAATHMVQKLDPSRPIDAVSGWYDQACGDFVSVHNYFRPLEVYKDTAKPPRAFVISEFGGLSYHIPKHSSLASSYGYESLERAEDYQRAIKDLLAKADALEQQGLAGFVYTQLSDVEEETNGLLTYDRKINKLG